MESVYPIMLGIWTYFSLALMIVGGFAIVFFMVAVASLVWAKEVIDKEFGPE